jgi:hypothetical protein
MTQNVATDSTIRALPDDVRGRFATLTFERDVAAPASVLWEAWTQLLAGAASCFRFPISAGVEEPKVC